MRHRIGLNPYDIRIFDDVRMRRHVPSDEPHIVKQRLNRFAPGVVPAEDADRVPRRVRILDFYLFFRFVLELAVLLIKDQCAQVGQFLMLPACFLIYGSVFLLNLPVMLIRRV